MAKNDDTRDQILDAVTYLTGKIAEGGLRADGVQSLGAAVRDLAEAYERIPETKQPAQAHFA